MRFTGERVVENTTPTRILSDHIARYNFAIKYAKEKNALDISCGTGYGTKILAAITQSVVGVDISEDAINFATANYTSPNLSFEVGDILDMEFSADCFDVITCFETVEHVSNQEKCFNELYRVLSEGGTLMISSPNRKLTSPSKSINDLPDNKFHTKEYLPNEFISLISEYFEISGVYGQRRIHKALFLPGIEQATRWLFPMLYHPSAGHPHMEQIATPYEYRYITIVCRK